MKERERKWRQERQLTRSPPTHIYIYISVELIPEFFSRSFHLTRRIIPLRFASLPTSGIKCAICSPRFLSYCTAQEYNAIEVSFFGVYIVL